MCTTEDRSRYGRRRLSYPSDMTDAEWALIAGMIPPAKRGGIAQTVDLREVVNGRLCVLDTGCQWLAIPKDLPPRRTLNGYFMCREWDGTLEQIHHALYAQCRISLSVRPARRPRSSTARASNVQKKGGLDRSRRLRRGQACRSRDG